MMRNPSARFPFALCAAAIAACSHAPPPATPAPQAAGAPAPAAAPGQPSLAGEWTIQLQVQGRSVNGAMHIAQSGEGYAGFLQLDTASQVSNVRSATVQGDHFVIMLTTPDGDARIEGTLRTPVLMEALYNGRHVAGRLIANRR
jgi:hypothetical protein